MRNLTAGNKKVFFVFTLIVIIIIILLIYALIKMISLSQIKYEVTSRYDIL